jgi:hypothetical protein
MKKKRIVDLEDELTNVQKRIVDTSKELKSVNDISQENKNEIKLLEEQLKELGVPIERDYSITQNQSQGIQVYSEEYFQRFSNKIEKEVLKEITSNSNLLPSLTKLDYSIAALIGFTGFLIDLLLVKIPKDTTYLNQYTQDGSELTRWLRSLGINEDGRLNKFLSKLEENTKVSYDASTTSTFEGYDGEVSGFYPKTHRLMSLGHDPFFGLVFSLIDIFNGSISLIDAKGQIHYIALENFQNTPLKGKAMAPLLWFGHILSDVCTKMGIPIPGWGFTQLLQFGSFGEKDRTVADITRWMYLNGYDLRHFITMGTVPGVIELFTRIYFKYTLPKEELVSPAYAKNLKEIHDHVRLQKLLFAAHSVATSGNVLKIILHQGNPLAFNTAELLGFIKQSAKMKQIYTREKAGEKVIKGRESINKGWNNI